MLANEGEQAVAERVAIVPRPHRFDGDGRIGFVDGPVHDAAVRDRSRPAYDRRAHAEPNHLEQGRKGNVVLFQPDLPVETIEQRTIGDKLEMAVLQDDCNICDVVPVDRRLLGKQVIRR